MYLFLYIIEYNIVFAAFSILKKIPIRITDAYIIKYQNIKYGLTEAIQQILNVGLHVKKKHRHDYRLKTLPRKTRQRKVS